MRATILPKAIILTKAHWAAVSMMAKGYIVAYRQKGSITPGILPAPNTSLSPDFQWVVNIGLFYEFCKYCHIKNTVIHHRYRVVSHKSESLKLSKYRK